MTLVDSNVILDVVTDNPDWRDWSLAEMTRIRSEGALLINDVIYAEVSVRFASAERVDDALSNV